jgi:hypothetical protein
VEEYHPKFFEKALKSDLLLKSITHSRIWGAIYESTDGKLLLEISARHVPWLLYAKPAPDLGLDDPQRVQLEKFPVASLELNDEDDITTRDWKLWWPHEREILATVTFKGLLVTSFNSDRGILAYSDTKVFNSCILKSGKHFSRPI